jgi:hypothetical protein
MTNLPRYLITQALDGKWIIACARDPDLGWSGQCWTERDGGHMVSFADQAGAEAYARELFKERETAK